MVDPGADYFEAQSDGKGEAARMQEYHSIRAHGV